MFIILVCFGMKFAEAAIRRTIKADFLSSQKPLAASLRVLASLQNNLHSSDGYDNLLNTGLTCPSNRDSQ